MLGSGFHSTHAQTSPQIAAEAAIVLDANTEKVIFSKNHLLIYPLIAFLIYWKVTALLPTESFKTWEIP